VGAVEGGAERARTRALDDSDLVDWFLDPDIQLPNPGTVTNAEPLLINHVGSLALRPEAHTEIGNLFLASDYVRTYTDLATMEAANEAARRATNAILAVSGITAQPCGLWEFDVPKPMRDRAGARPDSFPDGPAQPAPGRSLSDRVRVLEATMPRLRFLVLAVVAAWSATASGQSSTTVFEGARVIVGDARPPLENASFVVSGRRFVQVAAPPT
jgi:hypothetical protein